MNTTVELSDRFNLQPVMLTCCSEESIVDEAEDARLTGEAEHSVRIDWLVKLAPFQVISLFTRATLRPRRRHFNPKRRLNGVSLSAVITLISSSFLKAC